MRAGSAFATRRCNSPLRQSMGRLVRCASRRKNSSANELNFRRSVLVSQMSRSTGTFQEKLEELGHFWSNYKAAADLKLQFTNQLKLLLVPGKLG